ncbi:signal peptidase I [Candidatus Woesearchaeota archaeon]|nr:signal peptidase I [Candidatus Woesearchaeota archaeon]
MKTLKKLWHFIWHDNSALSWIINVLLAFVVVKYILFPGLSLALGTSYPLVAVVSCSMEHNNKQECSLGHINFDEWWEKNRNWYEGNEIYKDDFLNFKMFNGFNKGDIIILKNPEYIVKGDIIVFRSTNVNPIIHRIVEIYTEDGVTYYKTKGDNNKDSITLLGENKIPKDIIIGKAFFRVPYLGWIKVWFTDFLNVLGKVFL